MLKYYVSTEFKKVFLNRLLIIDGESVTICDPMTRSVGVTTLANMGFVLREYSQEITADEFINRFFFSRTHPNHPTQ